MKGVTLQILLFRDPTYCKEEESKGFVEESFVVYMEINSHHFNISHFLHRIILDQIIHRINNLMGERG